MFIILSTFFFVLFMLILGFIGESVGGLLSSSVDKSERVAHKENEAIYTTY